MFMSGLLFFMYIKKFFALILLAILFFSFVNINKVFAQNIMKITPSIIEDLIEPGEIIKKKIKVANYSNVELTMYAYIMDFKAADETGKAELIVPNTEEGNYISSWLDITAEALVFAPGEEKSIPFTINVPEKLGPGGYYGAIIFGTEPPKVRPDGEEKGAAISISQQTASLILLQVDGDVDERAEIKEFRVDKQIYQTPFTINFFTKIKNLGNVHIKPRGIIEVRNMLGKKVAVITTNDSGGNILPNSSRIFENHWQEDFGFGRYEASLAISFGTPAQKGGEGRKTLAVKTYFWVFPMKIIISAVLSIVITVLLFVLFLKFYKRRAIKKAMEQMGVRRKQMGHASRGYHSPVKHFILTLLILLVVTFAVMGLLYFFLF